MFWTIPFSSPQYQFDEYYWTNTTAWANWIAWNKPIGKSMCQILLIWAGGWGGTGVVWANSASAWGWGGWSWSQTVVTIPLNLLPDTLYISVAGSKTGAWVASYVSIYPTTTANHTLAIANGWGAGGNASGATAGAAGAAGAIATNATMPRWWAFGLAIAGQAGIIWWVAVAGWALTQPLTWLMVTGWTGWAWLPWAWASGLAGGAITAIADPSPFKWLAGGLWTASATTPPWIWQDGYGNHINWLKYWLWGTGGGSTHWTATGGGLVQASGWNGSIGCGGGGMWWALTGSSAGALSYGWAWYCQIICF